MLYPRNSISPPHILLGAVAQISDGVVQSSGVNVSIRPEGGVETTGVGVISYGALTSSVYYAPTQAETNYTTFSVVAYKSGCTPVGRTILTDDISGQIEAVNTLLDTTHSLVSTVNTDVLNLPVTSDIIELVNNVITDSAIITNITNKVNLTGITTSFSGAAASGINSIPKYGDTQRHTQDDFSTINKTADVIITRL